MIFIGFDDEQTVVFVLDIQTDIQMLEQFPSTPTLSITNLESFYNYRTVGPDLKLVTSALSCNNSFIELVINSAGSTSNPDYKVINEKFARPLDTEFETIHLKKQRLNSALNRIKAQNENTNADNLLYHDSFISQEKNMRVVDNPRANIGHLRVPATCREYPGKPSKPPCENCTSICSFTIESLLHPYHPASADDILAELSNHGHPLSRKTDNTNRTKQQAARELADHYIAIHNRTEPTFFI